MPGHDLGALALARLRKWDKFLSREPPAIEHGVIHRLSKTVVIILKLDGNLNIRNGIRKEIGDDIAIMVDVNGPWTPREAVEKIKEMAEYNVLWIEEPVCPMDDYEGLAYVRDNVPVRIAAGENEYTHYGFRQMITQRAVDILQPDVIKAGGIGVCRKILALAEAWNT